MERDATSFRAEIKKYEDTLAREPGSYCFAPLAELYRKLGRLDDAVTVARRGCELHPGYVGGFMALGRAYLEKGMKEEGRVALEKVIAITPDNLLARKLLSRIYVEQGDLAAADGALRLILAQNPDDPESRALLDSLKGTLPPQPRAETVTAGEYGGGDEEFFAEFGIETADSPAAGEIGLEDAELIEELTDEEFPEEDDFIVSPAIIDVPAGHEEFIGEGKNPLSTVTLAELYVSQGFLKRALTIYRELLDADPDNADLKRRLYDLKTAIDEDAASARSSLLAGDGAAAGERVVETLERWLDTIRRRR